MAKQTKKTVFRLVDECFKAQVWCFKHGYKIYPVVDQGKYRITIERGGAIKKAITSIRLIIRNGQTKFLSYILSYMLLARKKDYNYAKKPIK